MISTRGRYAIRVMLDIAENGDGHFIPLKDIAERQGISKKYLEIIVKDIVFAGLVEAASGKGGGYRLCRNPEGPLYSVACLAAKTNDCPRKEICQTLPMWAEFDKMVHNFFYGKKLSDLMTKQ